MNLPIQFPTDTEVIREEVSRFRTLTPEEKVTELDEMFELYHFLREMSGRAASIDQLAEDDERTEREAILSFARRHG